MSSVLVFTEPRKIDFEVVEDRPLEAKEIRVHTLYSGISAGTEMTAYRGSNPLVQKSLH